jgi:hypothetical protein
MLTAEGVKDAASRPDRVSVAGADYLVRRRARTSQVGTSAGGSWMRSSAKPASRKRFI